MDLKKTAHWPLRIKSRQEHKLPLLVALSYWNSTQFAEFYCASKSQMILIENLIENQLKTLGTIGGTIKKNWKKNKFV